VLTAEFIDGCKINDIDALTSMGLSLAEVSPNVFHLQDSFLQFSLRNYSDFMHENMLYLHYDVRPNDV
jgi:predicted unusual protein kinase regulating ubiquinone biosynthesis (AarF/ABC1/UbiB family)